MSCIIKNENGIIERVNADNGNESILFQDLNRLPFIKSPQQAAEMYAFIKEQDASKFLRDENGEPRLVFQPLKGESGLMNVDGLVFQENLQEALNLDKSKKGVRFGLLRAPNITEATTKSEMKHKELVEAADTIDAGIKGGLQLKLKDKTIFAVENAKDFFLVDTFDRDTNNKTLDGFLANLLNKGVKFTLPKQTKYTLTKPTTFFKGTIGKRNLDGTLRTMHPNVIGSFFSGTEKGAMSYAAYSADNIVTETLPAGTTFEVVDFTETLGKGNLGILREAETEAINNSSADVVKLITRDSRGIEEQYVFKNRPNLQFQIIGEQGAENLDKVEEVTYRLDNLNVAREMEKADKTPKEIRLATGWERGVDGYFRYEIADEFKENDVLNEVAEVVIHDRKSINKIETRVANLKWKGAQISKQDTTLLKEEADRLIEEYNAGNLLKEEAEGQFQKYRKELLERVKKAHNAEIGEQIDLLEKAEYSLFTDYKRVIELKELLPEIAKAYPKLNSLEIIFQKETEGSSTRGAYMQPDTRNSTTYGHIVIYASNKDNISTLKTIVLHEVQHAIQYSEGFAIGGNSSDMESIYEYFVKSGAEEKLNTLEAIPEKELTFDQKNEMVNLQIGRDKAYAEIDKYNGDVKYGKYKALAGEVEARNVADRSVLTTNQRREILIQETEDVAREDQIILQNMIEGSKSYSQTNTPQTILEAVGDKLKETGLAKTVFSLTNKEMEDKLVELGYDAKQMLGINSINNLQNKLTVVANKQLAEKLLSEGKSAKEIKRLTGFEKIDNTWKYEVPSGKLKNIPLEIGKEYDITEVVNNVEYAKGLKIIILDEKFTPTEDRDGSVPALYSRTKKRIEINADFTQGQFNNSETSAAKRKYIPFGLQPTIHHEISHFIQQIEGFDGGGNLSTVVNAAAKITGTKEGTSNEDFQRDILEKIKDETLKVNQKNILLTVKEILDNPTIEKALLIAAYKRIAGEYEARIVAQRAGLSEEQIANSLFAEEIDEEGVTMDERLFPQKMFVNNRANLTAQQSKDLIQAELLREQGESAKTIKDLTNWYFDNKEGWLYETIDNFLQTKDRLVGLLSDRLEDLKKEEGIETDLKTILGNNEIFNLIPDYNPKVVILISNKNANYSIARDTVTITLKDINEGSINNAVEDIYHEGQHAAANRLGITNGGNETTYSKIFKYLFEKENGEGERNELYSVAGRELYYRNKGEVISYDVVERLHDKGELPLKLGEGILSKNAKFSDILAEYGLIDKNGDAIDIVEAIEKFKIPMSYFSQGSMLKGITNGFVINEDVYLNSEANNPLNTMIHEFSHLFYNKLKTERPNLYAKGLELSETEEAKPYIDFVKANQPNLVEGTEAFKLEVLAQVTGDNGERLVNSQENSDLKQWLKDLWAFIKEKLGLTQYTDEQVANMNLQEYAEAVGIALMRGEELFKDSKITITEAIKRNNGNPLNLAPNGKPSILYKSYQDLGYSGVELDNLVSQVYSDEFQSWFGDWQNNPQNASKVVDENGMPKIVKHGTPNNDFFEFKGGFKNTDHGWLGTGFYFYGNNEEYARQYSNGGRVIGAFLNIREPYYATSEDMDTLAEEDSKAASDSFRDNIINEYDVDGVFYNGDLNEEWVTHNPNQIKSATENIGTFSNENNDIRFQKESISIDRLIENLIQSGEITQNCKM